MERNWYTLKNKIIILISLVLEHVLFWGNSHIHTRYVLISTNSSTFIVNGRDWKEYISIETIGNECRCVCCGTKCLINWLSLGYNPCKMKEQVKCYMWGSHWDGETYLYRYIYTHIIMFLFSFPSWSPDHHCFTWFMFFFFNWTYKILLKNLEKFNSLKIPS